MEIEFNDLEQRVLRFLKDEYLRKGGGPSCLDDPDTSHEDVMRRFNLDVPKYRELLARLQQHGIVDPGDLEVGFLRIDPSIVQIVRQLDEQPERSPEHVGTPLNPSLEQGVQEKTRGRIFIGHGHSRVWKDLKDFLQDRLRLEWDEFNREPTAGLSTKERLQEMLDNACFAFLVMTAEETAADGMSRARDNVIHEVGLFQGRLGFERAIVLLEEGCSRFSNIEGVTQIGFREGDIAAKFEEIRHVLEREGILGKGEYIVASMGKPLASQPDSAAQVTIELTNDEMRYLMMLSRPRNQQGIPLDSFDEFTSRATERYRAMVDKFLVHDLMRVGKDTYLLTERGYDLADRLWRVFILRETESHQKNQYDYVQTEIIAEATALTDGEQEAIELQRHLAELVRRNLLEPVPSDAAIVAARITPEGRLHHRPYSDIDFSDLD